MVTDWEALTSEIAEAISAVPDGSSLMIKVKDSDGLAVTFDIDTEAGLRLSAPGDRFLSEEEELGERGDRVMRSLGWLPPVESAPQGPRSPTSYYREWPHPFDAREAAELAVATLRSVFGAESPAALGYEAVFLPGGRFQIRRLSLEPIEETLLGPTLGTSAEDLDRYLEAYLSDLVGADGWERNDLGNYVTRQGSATIYLGVGKSDPRDVWIVAPLLWDVEQSEALLELVNDMNLHLFEGRAVLDKSQVAIIQRFPAYVFSITTLGFAFEQIAAVADAYDESLLARFGGRTSSSEDVPEPNPEG
jgi:hypothetical protein